MNRSGSPFRRRNSATACGSAGQNAPVTPSGMVTTRSAGTPQRAITSCRVLSEPVITRSARRAESRVSRLR